ncbi:hypothetical protein [Lysobacter claricitrinus]|uniref:hypothetical protein n=1 Tax=Lysobacter claricitrinus TaxID=3367728 RepID=UPI0038B31AB6
MHAIADTAARSSVIPVDFRREARADIEAYEFRRVDYTDGWDDDDAALGWIDVEVMKRGTRRRAAN